MYKLLITYCYFPNSRLQKSRLWALSTLNFLFTILPNFACKTLPITFAFRDLSRSLCPTSPISGIAFTRVYDFSTQLSRRYSQSASLFGLRLCVRRFSERRLFSRRSPFRCSAILGTSSLDRWIVRRLNSSHRWIPIVPILLSFTSNWSDPSLR